MKPPSKNEIRKPTKTISGITPVAVMLPPKKCRHGNCIYCPSLNVPQSYTPKSPVVLRASSLNYDSYKQVQARIESFEAMHHPTDKIEIIIMGGTFLQYPKKFQYNFIKNIYNGLNGKKSKTLKQAQKINKTAKHRCIALCIETRPDVCCKFIHRMREFGCTRVELGVQIIDDKIYKKINRGHSVKDVINATECLKNAGFKVGYHIMPGLPGSNPKKDLILFKKIFSDERFKPDQLKIYPCQVMPNSELEKLYWQKKYKPYTKEQIEKLLIKMLKIVPRYCRVMRIMREIHPDYIVAGTTKIDLRKDIEEKLRNKKIKLNEIRYREIGFALKDNSFFLSAQKNARSSLARINLKSVNTFVSQNNKESLQNSLLNEVKLKITKYRASNGDEYFLEIVDKHDILFGLLRLRIIEVSKSIALKYVRSSLAQINLSSINNKIFPNTKNYINAIINSKRKNLSGSEIFEPNQSQAKQDKLKEKIAIIRELHIYGQSLKLGEVGKISQHKGLGKWLMSEAEKIAQNNKCKKIFVISGIGVMEYYKKLGYDLEESYMVKFL